MAASEIRDNKKRKNSTSEELAITAEDAKDQFAESSDSNGSSKRVKEENNERNEKSMTSSTTSKNLSSSNKDSAQRYLYQDVLTKITNDGIKQLIKRGYKINTGRFTPAEDRIIQLNMQEFVEKHKKPVNWILGFNTISKNKDRREFLQTTNFYKHLARGLSPSRLLDSVRKRARKVCNEYYVPPRKQPFTEEMAQTFREHLEAADQRKKFVEVSEQMHVTPFRLCDAYKYTKVRKGRLNKEDKKLIKNAVFVYCRRHKLSIWGRDMDFRAISSGVEDIDSVAFYRYWVKQRIKMVHKNLLPLITKLIDSGVKNYEDIDWKGIKADSHDLQVFTGDQVSELFRFALDFFLTDSTKDSTAAKFRKQLKRMKSFYSAESTRNNMILNQMPRFKIDRKSMNDLDNDSS